MVQTEERIDSWLYNLQVDWTGEATHMVLGKLIRSAQEAADVFRETCGMVLLAVGHRAIDWQFWKHVHTCLEKNDQAGLGDGLLLVERELADLFLQKHCALDADYPLTKAHLLVRAVEYAVVQRFGAVS
jgi:hypothetical protein